MKRQCLLLFLTCLIFPFALADAAILVDELHDHRHGNQDQDIEPPKVYLDKSPRAVAYQLKRLDNARLLLVERGNDDKKYLPVHLAILKRSGMARQNRENALQAIVEIKKTEPVSELLAVIGGLSSEKKNELAIAKQLSQLLLEQSPAVLGAGEASITKAAKSEKSVLRTAGLAALMTAGQAEAAFELVKEIPAAKVDFLKAVPMLGSAKTRNSLRKSLLDLCDASEPVAVRRASIAALATISDEQAETFRLVANFVTEPKLRRVSIKTILKLPREVRDEKTATMLAEFLTKLAETTPPAERTTNEFLEAMTLADQTLVLVSKDKSKDLRERMDEVVVRVVLIHTVEEEMRYDVPWFAVEAGRDIQVVLKNEDLMPHNLVFTTPGSLQDVAIEGSALGPKIGESGKQYVPASPNVVFASKMVASEKFERMTFKAPSEPGEYPYVCTFPGHWMRMYGVMVVVKDLSEFQRNPVEPKDPVGSNRAFVQAWKHEDLNGKYESGLRGRSMEIGKKIFAEATCAQCHKVAGEGKVVGPELTDVWARWKGDAAGIFREIVEPSHKIEPKYVVRKLITLDGEVISGIVLTEDKESISILPNPESTEPTVVAQDDIEDMVESSVSIMPKGLMDRFTEDEIMELMAYLQNAGSNAK